MRAEGENWAMMKRRMAMQKARIKLAERERKRCEAIHRAAQGKAVSVATPQPTTETPRARRRRLLRERRKCKKLEIRRDFYEGHQMDREFKAIMGA